MPEKIAVLHLSLNPVTGPWSALRHIALGQIARPDLYAGASIAVVAPDTWPALCGEEAAGLPLPVTIFPTPAIFGTAQCLYQMVKGPPLGQWVDELRSRTGCQRVIIHCHNGWHAGVFLPLRVSDPDNVRLVTTLHGISGHFAGRPVRTAIQKWIARRVIRADASITSVDAAHLPMAEELFGFNRAAITVIPNGVPKGAGLACPRLRDATRPFTVCFVGLLNQDKGWRFVAEAVLALGAEGLNIRGVFAGLRLPGCDLEALCRRHPDRLAYAGFVANPRDKVMLGADVLALPSSIEGLPMVIVEAMSVGLPVISTSVGGIPEAVADGETGYLVPRTTEAVASKLRDMYAQPDLLAKFQKGAAAKFQREFDIDIIVEKYHGFYCDVLSGRR